MSEHDEQVSEHGEQSQAEEEIQDLDLDESEEGRQASEGVTGGYPVTERPIPGRSTFS